MSAITGKCDECNGDLDRVTDTTAHTYLRHTLLDCRTHERDAALVRAEETEGHMKVQADVLREAEHSLITLGGLWATDVIDKYNDTIRNELDASELLFQIDETAVIQHIQSVLATTPTGRGEGTGEDVHA